MYELEIEQQCEEEIRKACNRNMTLREALEKKVGQIMQRPYAFKPLRKPLEGKWRAHMGVFVLIYMIYEERNVVRLIRFRHHNKVYV